MAKRQKGKYQEQVEGRISDSIWNEYDVAKRNQSDDVDEFEKIIDLIECKRTEKDYEWLSDVFIPEYPSIHLTEASQWANQYFPTRDFVDVYLDTSTEDAAKKAAAAKTYVNCMLNTKALYHYQKYMKARSINSTFGCVYAVCSWRQKINKVKRTIQVPTNVGIGLDGVPIMANSPEEVTDEFIVEDRFHYEVPDPRNVFTDSSYCYSIQEKEWVIVRSQMSYEQLRENEEANGYINLGLVKDLRSDGKTETESETGKDAAEPYPTGMKYLDVLERFGKTWAIVDERDEFGYPMSISPGINDRGEIKPGAELVEAIVTIACANSKKVLIRFQPTPFRTANNVPFRPVVRGLNYIHPTKDVGMSDAKYAKELQIALNDTINLSNDRVKLATMPTLKVRRYALEDNDSIYFEPEHMMMVENPDDITEFQIRDNMQGALAQAQMFINKMQQVESIYPTTMGDLPGRASTTATAIQGATTSNNLRANYKSLTFEYTFLAEFYWMMLQMGYQFMRTETAQKVLGANAPHFDPEADYHYQPVSSNIEVEYNKNTKVRNLDQMVGRLSGLVPAMPGLIFPILKMLEMQFMLMGQEPQTVLPYLMKVIEMGMSQQQGAQEGGPVGAPEGEQGERPPGQPSDLGPEPMSNQNEIPMGGMENMARQNASGML